MSDYSPNYFLVEQDTNWSPPVGVWCIVSLNDNSVFPSKHFRIVGNVLQVNQISGVFLLSAQLNFIRTNGAKIRVVIERTEAGVTKEIVIDFATTAISWSHGNDWTNANSSILNFPIELRFLDLVRLECIVETTANNGGCNIRHNQLPGENTTVFGSLSMVLLNKTGEYTISNTLTLTDGS